MSETATDVMDRIKRNNCERSYCLAVLDLWANVQTQGIAIESVDKFGFDPGLLSKADKAKMDKARIIRQADPFVEHLPNGGHRLKVYNYIRHHNGSITQLEPMLKAPYRDEYVSE
jgi:hypothetical protein